MRPYQHILLVSLFLLALGCHAEPGKDPRLSLVSSQELSQGIAQMPVSSTKHIQLISRARSSNLADEAYRLYKQAWIKTPNNPYSNLLKGLAAENYWAYATAPSVAKLHPSAPEARALLKDAHDGFAQAFKLQPASAVVNMEYGFFLWRYYNQMERGLPLLRRGLALAPQSPTAHALIGNVYSNPFGKAYDPKSAEQHLLTATSLDPMYAYPHSMLVFLYIQQKRFTDAQEQMQAYLRLSPPAFAQDAIVKLLQSAISKGLNKS